MIDSPHRLLVVMTGNVTNAVLLALFATHLDTIRAAFDQVDFVEIGPEVLVQHRRRGGTDGPSAPAP